MDHFLKALTLILISSVKFVAGPPLVYLREQYNFTWLETNVYAIIGGMIGVLVFMHVSDWIYELWHSMRDYFWHKKQQRETIFSPPKADTDEEIQISYSYIEKPLQRPRRIFTSRSRKMVKLWRKYGLIGLAAVTPMVFSIPLGIFFMTRFEKNKRKIILYMFISITAWSLILTSAFELLHVRNIQEIIK
jgi:hypothetical protein